MNLVKPILLVLFSFILIKGTSQDCKYPKKMSKYAQKHLKSEKIVSATKFEVTFKDFNKVGSTHFVRSNSGYFIGLTFLRDFSRKMDVMVDNPFIFKLKNDSLVTLYPAKSAYDKGNMGFTTPMGTKILRAYYELSSEQLQLFASISIKNVKLYVTLKNKAKESDNALDILDFEIKKEKWQSNFMASAKCILQ